MVHLKLVNLFIEKQVMLPAALSDIQSEILGCKNIFFCQNILVQGTEITMNMNCRFYSFELYTLFFGKVMHLTFNVW